MSLADPAGLFSFMGRRTSRSDEAGHPRMRLIEGRFGTCDEGRPRTHFPAVGVPEAVCKSVRPNHVQAHEHWTQHWKPYRIAGGNDPVGITRDGKNS